MYGLGHLYMYQERYHEGEEQFKKGVEAGQHWFPGKNLHYTFRNINGLAVLCTRQKQYDQAEILFDEALKGRQRELGEDHPETLESKNDLAVLYKEQARYEEAEKYLLEAVKGRRLKLGDQHPRTLESLNNLIELYEAWNKPEKAEEWRAKLPVEEDMEK
ncbi:tetratricopeptide repeat protein [Planctomycetota bacterium]